VTALLHLVPTGLVCLGAVPLLARASWPARAPRIGILLWQAIVLTVPLCAVGTLLAWGLRGYPGGLPDAWADAVSDLASVACWYAERVAHPHAEQNGAPTHVFAVGQLVALVVATSATLGAALVVASTWAGLERVRRRHRKLLDLVAVREPAAPGADVLDHPLPFAYCVPGRRPRVVISTGALRVLDDQQVRAVLAHEWAHARWRHDLVLLPFAAFERLPPRLGVPLRAATEAVSTLIEMCADDQARRKACPRSLASALVRLSTAGPGLTGTLGIDDGATAARLVRLLAPRPPLARPAKVLVVAAGATLVSTPLSFLLCFLLFRT
jgi:hypothetical protein